MEMKMSKKKKAVLQKELEQRQLKLQEMREQGDTVNNREYKKLLKDIAFVAFALQVWG